MNVLQKIAALFFVGLFVLMAALPSVASAAQQDEYVFILKAKGNPYWTAMADGIKETAKAKGIKATVYQTETDRDAEGEITTCMTAIQRKPKVLVMAAVNPSVAVQCFKQASAVGIMVADVDANISVEDAQKAGIKLAFSAGSDNFLIGQEAGKFSAKLLNIPKPKIFILEGAVGNIPGKKRVDGFRTKFQELAPNVEIVASISAEWDRLKAMNMTTDLLQRQPDIDLIYAANDTMALGAAEAVRNSGKGTGIKIIGVDGTGDARKAILDGRLTASVAQLPYLMGMRATELAIEAAQQSKTGLTEIIPTPVLTKESITAKTDPLLQYVR